MATPTATEVDQAFGTILDRVDADAFFSKLASYGIEPRSQEEARELMGLGFKLTAVQDVLEKQSQAGQMSKLASLNASLDQVLREAGIAAPNTQLVDAGVKAAAAAYLQDPAVYAAARTIKLAQTAALQQQTAQ